MNNTTSWRTYEEVATHLLSELSAEFGLQRVEAKQRILGQRSGTLWEIDAKGVYFGGGFVVVQIRRHTTSKQSQGDIGELAYTIHDTGGTGGVIVSPLGIQKGAELVAKAEK